MKIAAVIEKTDIVLGNDSGMCHVAGFLRKPALALCAPTSGSIAFGGWPTVRWMQAEGSCTGCLWYQDDGWKPWCGFGCELLADIKPNKVIPMAESILREEGIIE